MDSGRQVIQANSLQAQWTGFAWMNPFGSRNALVPWLHKFFQHRNGIALVPDRTSAPWLQYYVPLADLVLFVSPKLKFLDATGQPGRSPAQVTCLLAAGPQAIGPLQRAKAKRLGVLMKPP